MVLVITKAGQFVTKSSGDVTYGEIVVGSKEEQERIGTESFRRTYRPSYSGGGGGGGGGDDSVGEPAPLPSDPRWADFEIALGEEVQKGGGGLTKSEIEDVRSRIFKPPVTTPEQLGLTGGTGVISPISPSRDGTITSLYKSQLPSDPTPQSIRRTEKAKEVYNIAKDVFRGGFFYGLYQTPRTFPKEETYKRAGKFLTSPVGGIYGIGGPVPLGMFSSLETVIMGASGRERDKLIKKQTEIINDEVKKINNAGSSLTKYDSLVKNGEFTGSEEQYKDYQKTYDKYNIQIGSSNKKMNEAGISIIEKDKEVSYKTSEGAKTMIREIKKRGTTF